MKQITLYPYPGLLHAASAPCLGKMAFAWGAYGFAIAVLWRALPRDPLDDAAAWLVALLAGLALAGWTRGA